MSSPAATAMARGATDRIVRHALPDRIFHWLTAACVLTLLATAFLPILGFMFPWLTPHWVAGLVLIAAVVYHTIRALFWQQPRTMFLGRRDARDLLEIARWNLRMSSTVPGKPGKYSLAQKLIHHLFSLVLLAAVVTGVMMMVKVDTPWWDRNPYWLDDASWGVVYVVHGLAALLLVTMIIAHVYFALRPEKLLFTRAMILGWITRGEYSAHHDRNRWQAGE